MEVSLLFANHLFHKMARQRTNSKLKRIARRVRLCAFVLMRRATSIYDYCREGVWNDVGGSRQSSLIKIINLAVNSFTSKRLQQKACALTYSTVLALVPMLAMLFAIGRGFGFQNILQSELFRYFPSQRNALNSSLSFVDSYLEQASQGVFVGIGVIFLLWTLISLMRNVESSFNEVWGVTRNRSIYRQVTDYTVMFLFLPVLILLSAGINIFVSAGLNQMLGVDALSPAVGYILDLSPMVIAWLVFTCAFWLIPNTSVRLKPAVIAGILCGTFTHLMQWAFVSGQVYVSKYNAIYGSFAFLPLLLIWLQLVWMFTLAGVVMTYSMQTASSLNFNGRVQHISVNYFNRVTVLLLALISQRYTSRLHAMGVKEMAKTYGLPPSLVQRSVQRLEEVKLLSRVAVGNTSIAYEPSFPVGEQLTVGQVVDMLNDCGQSDFVPVSQQSLSNALRVLGDICHNAVDCDDVKINELITD